MKALRILLLTVAGMCFAGLATAQQNKEVQFLCSTTGADCNIAQAAVNWGQDTYVEFSIKDTTGCPDEATYQVIARNANSSVDIPIVILSLDGIRSQVFLPLQWYRDWLVEPSDLTGCTSLVIVMHIVRPPSR